MPFENSVKRMFVIVKGMHHDATESLLKDDPDLATDVIERDRDVDRLFWLIARQANMIMQNVHLSGKMNTTIAQMFPYYQVGRIIERVGDHCVRMAGNARKVHREEIGEELASHVLTASDVAIRIFEKSVEAFFSHDLKRANQMIESIHQLENNYIRINQEILRLPTAVAVSIRNISDSIRRTGEYSADIAENVINNEMMTEGRVHSGPLS
jgi:phosphate uptake regulator